jgi:methylenetetrahydrofolate dehydrogenase (NADP+)/methenyltetrahydrofolate cyclohydrolase
MAQLIDGKVAAARLRDRMAVQAADLAARTGRPAGLRVVLVGDHPASAAYVRTKERMARSVGIDALTIRLDAGIGERELLGEIHGLNRDAGIDGILVQLPLPRHIDVARIVAEIDPAKDVDGFHPLNVGRLVSAQGAPPPDLLIPCTPRGCMRLLEETLGAEGLRGQRALVIGRSAIVGKPMASLLLGRDCTVAVAHSRTRDLRGEARRAEILVAAIGRPEHVAGDWIAEGAVVIDVGINRVPAPGGGSRLVGDVAFAEASRRALAITPVPGGVGPMTVACLLENTLIACRSRLGIGPA